MLITHNFNIIFIYICYSLTFKNKNIMKKNYFLLAILSFVMVTMNAQWVDNIEEYATGNAVDGENFVEWGPGAGYGTSSNVYAFDGTQSMLVGGDGVDPVVDLGNKIFGTWYFSFQMYVPSDKEAYMNVQGTVPIAGGEWVIGDWYFNQGLLSPNVGTISDTALGLVEFDFPHDEWFKVELNVDISLGIALATVEIKVNGSDVVPAGTAFTNSGGTTATALGGINIYSVGPNMEAYFDDFILADSIMDTQDFATKGFRSAMSNGTLTMRAQENINSVAVYNMLGQQVYNANVNAMQSTVDMSNLSNGTYIVKVNINGTEGSVKVIR